jgi:hypothetical protein
VPTQEEKEAILRGVEEHGSVGKWALIGMDPVLLHRSSRTLQRFYARGRKMGTFSAPAALAAGGSPKRPVEVVDGVELTQARNRSGYANVYMTAVAYHEPSNPCQEHDANKPCHKLFQARYRNLSLGYFSDAREAAIAVSKCVQPGSWGTA